MADQRRDWDEERGMRVICYVICAASIAICIALLIQASLGW